MNIVNRSIWFLIVLFYITVNNAAFAEPSTHIPTTSDWSEEAVLAKNQGVPILVIFSSDNCSYCEQLMQQVINPMLNSGTLSQLAHVREFNIGRGGKITDFDGDPVRSRVFVGRYGVFATPTVVLLDYNGNQLSPSIVGFDGVDQYPDHLAEAIQNAHLSSAMQHTDISQKSVFFLSKQ